MGFKFARYINSSWSIAFGGENVIHFDDPELIENFFSTLQLNYLEVFHPFLITTRAYKPLNK